MSDLGLSDLIDSVRSELLEHQKANQGDDAFLKLKECELEVALAIKQDGGGKAKLFVVEVDSNIATEKVHRVKMTFEHASKPPQKSTASVAEIFAVRPNNLQMEYAKHINIPTQKNISFDPTPAKGPDIQPGSPHFRKGPYGETIDVTMDQPPPQDSLELKPDEESPEKE